MLNNKMWSIFKKTGNIEAYLYYKLCNDKLKPSKDHLTTQQLQMIETTKINSL